jgi:hypothetical protein
MKIERTGSGAGSAQRVLGSLISWDPIKGTIAFKSAVSHQDEEIAVRSLHFELPRDNPVAQVAQPRYEPLGPVSSSFRAKDVTVVKGVLTFRWGVETDHGNIIAFEGTVMFSAATVLLKGDVFEKKFPSGGSSDSTRDKSG